MSDYLMIKVRIPILLPDDNETTWPASRCQKAAQETADDIDADWNGARLVDWWITSSVGEAGRP